MTQPVEVTFSPVKEAIEAQSGRLELLKQALTLGLAGVGGLAALFIDAGKVPGGPWSKGIICAGGVALLAVAAAALCGIGAYANFLRHTEAGQNAQHYRTWIARFINARLVALFFAGLLLIVFAAMRIFSTNALGPEEALATARNFMVKQFTLPPQSLVLNKFVSEPADYVVRYVVESTNVAYVIRVHRGSGELDLERIPPALSGH